MRKCTGKGKSIKGGDKVTSKVTSKHICNPKGYCNNCKKKVCSCKLVKEQSTINKTHTYGCCPDCGTRIELEIFTPTKLYGKGYKKTKVV